MNNYNVLYSEDYLEHHGILGQKWGKKNGPPYPLDPATDYSKAEKNAKKAKSSKSDKVLSKEELSKLSDEELRKKIERMNLEDRYNQLSKKDIKTGADKVREFFQTTSSLMVYASTAVGAAQKIYKVVKKKKTIG